jgi:uncharacterized protein (DUF4415 family)
MMSVKFSSTRPLTDEEETEIQAMIAADPDNPELTDEELASIKPFREVLPELAAAMDKAIAARGRPPLDQTKVPVTIRLDADVVELLKASGKGWQSRANDMLRKAVGI